MLWLASWPTMPPLSRKGNLWQPPGDINLVKAEYREDVSLPGSGCSRACNLLS